MISPPHGTWLDDTDGPTLRLYTMTGGRTRPSSSFDLIAYIRAVQPRPDAGDLQPQYLAVLDLCRRPQSVAEIASQLDLPLGVLRILLSDLFDRKLIYVQQSATAKHPDARVVREVLDGLHDL